MKWKLALRLVNDLKELHKNPRQLTKHAERNITKSIQRFGLPEKIIINTDNTIIGGHQRTRILKKLGIKEIECWVPEEKLSDKQVEELNIRLNQNTGDWDYDILGNEFDLLELTEWGFDCDDLLHEETIVKNKILDNDVDENKTICPHCGKEIDV